MTALNSSFRRQKQRDAGAVVKRDAKPGPEPRSGESSASPFMIIIIICYIFAHYAGILNCQCRLV